MIIKCAILIVSFIISAILGKILIPVLKKLKIGQSERQEGPRAHLRKQGTPTMGGIWVIITMVVMVTIYLVVNRNNLSNCIPIIAISLTSLGFGLIGFIDDFKKIVLKNTDGLSPKLKMFGLLIISICYTVFLIKYASIGTGIIIPIMKYEFVLPVWIYIPFIILVMLASTNAVNLTDGIDGLAGSVSTIMLLAISIIAYKCGYESINIFGLIMAGAVFGFLIYNFYKAKVMMGDTGSLLLGGVISSMTIYMKLPLILLIVAIIPVVETLSVILQFVWLYLKKRRLFKMTPLHHHFELSGWRENKVVAIFSLVTLVASIASILIV